ncbi:D-alanyl-D-alanine carboxypeptidase family protein [Sulfurospirillum deleyianum]|uniref:Peptidase S11 D-alanyl-D-alanine carboxypeptidase 1 n=1 Tax=Sulfurospirillum deleyianum (strain ATCC 51133 / DSM 6946 / 5175) TaxID=525898 RepID=D1B3R5_SULD5|nr:serine hydrolase [Sulfurospirillum deleyianum]ACZ12735.1 peptidase S11 D-alanyl-D-alanine carboxypeptidase 1 [Sulfurospirillum deleyianum DSM 6946]
MTKKFLTLLCGVSLLTTSLSANYLDKETAARLSKNTDAIIAKDLSTKELIFSKDAQKINQPASLTKIMTAMLAIESGRMNDVVTITRDMIQVEPTKAGLRIGEKFYLRDLVKAAMVMSANDAAMSIGVYLGDGNVNTFVAKMNRKAKQLGMNNTNFTNPCGFDIGDHHSTALDLLKMSEYAIKNSQFNEMAKLKRHDFKSLNTKRAYAAYTHNKLLNNYKYAVGIKTGYTRKAGPCLIARAKNGNKDVLVVMLNSEQRWKDIKTIFEDVLPQLTKTAVQVPTQKPVKKIVTPKQKKSKKTTKKKKAQNA